MNLKRFVELQQNNAESKRQRIEQEKEKKYAAEQLFLEFKYTLNEALRQIFSAAGFTRCIDSNDHKFLIFSAPDADDVTVSFEIDEGLSMDFDVGEKRIGKVLIHAAAPEILIFFAHRENESLMHAKAMTLEDAVDAVFLRSS